MISICWRRSAGSIENRFLIKNCTGNGNATYIRIVEEQEQEATEQEYLELLKEYGESQTVHFSYGAEDSVNEYPMN